jgi:methyltransferase (TIGR00027 family)
MLEGQFSRTALGAAGHRAAHQLREGGRIFADPLAVRILGADAATMLAEADADPRRRGLRLFIAARSRFAEEAARRAIREGARQIVVLGAGLDTFAYRLESVDGLRVFEVDHPATQIEKRRRLAAADIEIPAHLTFAPCDFERAELADALRSAGFDEARRSVFLWLGVTPYLTRESILATLSFIASLPGGAEVVFDYANPPESIADPDLRRAHETLAERVAAAGEAFRNYFVSSDLHAILRGLGFERIEDLGPREIAARFLGVGAPSGRTTGGHVIWAAR